MLNNKVIIIDNSLELETVENAFPELKNAPLILLSNNFNPSKLQDYRKRGFSYFDEKITDIDAEDMVNIIHRTLWNWFMDGEGNDISLIDGCSFGKAFASSTEILLNTILRYKVGLKKLLNAESKVYFVSNTEDIFLAVIKQLRAEIGFKTEVIEHSGKKKDYLYGRKRLKLDCLGRKRDLAPLFNKGRVKDILISVFLKLAQYRKVNKKSILIVPAGKLEEYFDYKISSGNTNGYCFILPFNIKNIYALLKKMDKVFYFYSFPLSRNKKINDIIYLLENNIRNMVNEIEPDLLIPVMKRHIFSYFQGAFSYYANALKELQRLSPDMVVLSADAYENHILIAQAAKKLKIATALIPHGLYGWGYSEYKSGAQKIFDYYLAFGKKDLLDYKEQGVEDKDIVISSFPYFSRFFPRVPQKSNNYRKALILPLDFINISPSERIGGALDYLYAMMKLLKDMGIEIAGIKGREEYIFKLLDLHNDYLDFSGDKVMFLSGYASFPDSVKNVDIVIGPACTAAIEAGLLGIDYYIFYPGYCIGNVPSLTRGIFKIANVAGTVDELRENIGNKRPYLDNCSVEDLIDINMVNSREDLYLKFENALRSICN